MINGLNGNLLIIRKSKIKLVDSSSSKCIQLLIVNVDSTVIEIFSYIRKMFKEGGTSEALRLKPH